MNEKIDRKIFSKYANEVPTSGEKNYVENVFLDEQNSQELQEILMADWLRVCDQEHLEFYDLSHIFHKLYFSINSERKQQKRGAIHAIWQTYSKIAAAILLPLALIYLVYSHVQPSQPDTQISFAEIKAPLGSRVNFSLPDGSSGWLNSGSSLKYPVYFSDTRDVELSGEAFFDIQKNERKPFNVKTADLNISVLGTRFNVSAYQGDASSSVVLESGKVRLSSKGAQNVVEMKPDEKVVYNNTQKELKKTSVNSAKYTSWKEGKLVFRNDPMKEVANRLSRWYNVDIEVSQKESSDLRLRATFEDEEIEEVLRLLKLTFPIDYKFEERKKGQDGSFEKRKIRIEIK